MKIIDEKNPQAIDLAFEFLKAGKVISFATDTVYGIAVDATNDKAVDKLYQLKKRDEKKPIAIFLPDLKSAEKIFVFDELAKKISTKLFPGALTLVLKTKEKPEITLAKNLNYNADGFLGFRIVDSFFVKKLFERFDGVLAVSSANLSGKNPAQNHQEVAKYFPNLDLLVGGEISTNSPSTVAKIFDGKITILRQGSLKIYA